MKPLTNQEIIDKLELLVDDAGAWIEAIDSDQCEEPWDIWERDNWSGYHDFVKQLINQLKKESLD